MQTKKSEIGVGLFMLIAFAAILFLCLRVANMHALDREPTYRLYAKFGNVGGLKVNSPVKIGGVVIGRVASVSLEPKTFQPVVALNISRRYDHLPDTSSLSIRTSGLLGEQYLALNVGFDDPDLDTGILRDGDTIQDTKSALVLEDLIGQFLYRSGNGNTPDGGNTAPATDPAPSHE